MWSRGRQQNSWVRQQTFGARFTNKMADFNRKSESWIMKKAVRHPAQNQKGTISSFSGISRVRCECSCFFFLFSASTTSMPVKLFSYLRPTIVKSSAQTMLPLFWSQKRTMKICDKIMLSTIDCDRLDRPLRPTVSPFDRFRFFPITPIVRVVYDRPGSVSIWSSRSFEHTVKRLGRTGRLGRLYGNQV